MRVSTVSYVLAAPLLAHAYRAQQEVLGLQASPQTVDGRPSVLPLTNSTVSYWMKYLDKDHKPALNHGSEGTLTNEADICIIGSGITGVSTAYHLSQAIASGEKVTKDPLKVVILEAREFCTGATGRNGGHLVPNAFENFFALAKSFGTSGARRALELERYTSAEVTKILKKSGKAKDVDFISSGRVIFLFTEEEEAFTHAEFNAAKASGLDMSGVEWFTKEETQEKYKVPYPSVRIPGNNVWPLKLVSHLFTLAESASPDFNLTLHTRTPVTSLTPTPGSSRNVTLHTPRGDVKCTVALHATNGYASHLLPFMHGEIVPTRGQIIATRANVPYPFGSPDRREGYVANNGFEYWFPRPKNTPDENELAIVGGGHEVLDGGRLEQYTIDDSTLNAKVGKVLRDTLPAVYPGKFDVGQEPEVEWTGILGFTKTGEPFVGPVIDADAHVHPGQYIAAGFSGHGMPRTFAAAEAVAGIILADLKGEAWSFPEWFPEFYLTTNRPLGQKV
ncbi:FAD dependent oxidoreductase [Irpex lacteus]|nr:FAD dependent oxidoreductase [Irpex lacteus]